MIHRRQPKKVVVTKVSKGKEIDCCGFTGEQEIKLLTAQYSHNITK